ncbi:MAG: DUF6364 family protein [Flavobacteriales bacterium]|jgi:hypothetical protein|nr:DUF6364 family protein [Flavobacteriales bacterium]
MDAKVTLSFNEQVIAQAKAFAEEHNISLSRLTEFLLSKAVSKKYRSIDELPVSEWVNMVSEGQATYVRKNARSVKKDYLESRKR